ncbi:hypothetical protein SKAU_G00056170 [Synaphobranchus kaupii]|uniref:Uncharacterized protein n=1 Tax=Synaphobranchus kaupii TaxID=118154 RepID=A0A9Q1G3Z7_SYNKA|nr:hypothetical protein SKAU_G00056170 [Synaphobranchus kaupii]
MKGGAEPRAGQLRSGNGDSSLPLAPSEQNHKHQDNFTRAPVHPNQVWGVGGRGGNRGPVFSETFFLRSLSSARCGDPFGSRSGGPLQPTLGPEQSAVVARGDKAGSVPEERARATARAPNKSAAYGDVAYHSRLTLLQHAASSVLRGAVETAPSVHRRSALP